MTIRLLPFAEDNHLLDQAVRVYTTIWRHREYHSSLGFFTKYARIEGFVGLVAVTKQNQVVGMGFGTKSATGQWWHDKVAQRMGINHPALQDAWVLIELGVLETYRDQQIGSCLLNTLMTQQTCSNALLSTLVSNVDAQRFYQRHGWTVLHPGFAFVNGDPEFMIMHKTQ